mmetsp:Transcript_48783/g.74240  ORF Transcript_48783/g.74240 Transcript_48783/m.74240 type:complete len:85 (+) Transcript_48783:627-881(+)
MALLEKNIWVRNSTDWLTKDIEKVNKYLFLTTKPVIYLVNLSEADFKRKKNKWLPKIAEWIKDPNNVEGPIIPYSADFEKKILD